MRRRFTVRALALATLALAGCRSGVRNPSRPRLSSPSASLPEERPAPRAVPPAAGMSDADPLYFSYVGRAPPALSADGTWVVGAPTTLEALKGRVVYLQFAFIHCGGCGPMMPYLKSWHEKHAAKGLSVVYVDNGGVDALADARKEVAEQKIAFPWFHDALGATTRAYGVRSFPTAYVIDKAGKVVWDGPPGGQEAALEALLVGLLSK